MDIGQIRLRNTIETHCLALAVLTVLTVADALTRPRMSKWDSCSAARPAVTTLKRRRAGVLGRTRPAGGGGILPLPQQNGCLSWLIT